VRIAVFSTGAYDRRFLEEANERHGHELTFLEARLEANTAALAEGHDAVCPFVNDRVDAEVDRLLAAGGTRAAHPALRGLQPRRPRRGRGARHHRGPGPGLLPLRRRRAHRRADAGGRAPAPPRLQPGPRRQLRARGLLGFDLRNKRVGIIGTGKIGQIVARILRGFGCSLRAYDPFPNDEVRDYGVRYVDLDTLFAECDVITLHCPLTPETHHIIDADASPR
jgi:D-lactate dehydrogenase